MAGSEQAITQGIGHILYVYDCAELDVKYSHASAMPFYRMKVRLKKEIVTMGAGELDPATNAGIYVETQDWNALIEDPDTIILHRRNAYEVWTGTSQGAIDPETGSFGEITDWIDRCAHHQGK